MGSITESHEKSRPKRPGQRIAAPGEIWSSELCDDVERCIQGYTAVSQTTYTSACDKG